MAGILPDPEQEDENSVGLGGLLGNLQQGAGLARQIVPPIMPTAPSVPAIRIRPTSINDAHGGEMFGEKVLTVNGEPHAAADLSVYPPENTVWIKNIVTKSSSRRQGYATSLVNDLFNEFPDYKIQLSNTTQDGTKFFGSKFNIDESGYITPKGLNGR